LIYEKRSYFNQRCGESTVHIDQKLIFAAEKAKELIQIAGKQEKQAKSFQKTFAGEGRRNWNGN